RAPGPSGAWRRHARKILLRSDRGKRLWTGRSVTRYGCERCADGSIRRAAAGAALVDRGHTVPVRGESARLHDPGHGGRGWHRLRTLWQHAAVPGSGYGHLHPRDSDPCDERRLSFLAIAGDGVAGLSIARTFSAGMR